MPKFNPHEMIIKNTNRVMMIDIDPNVHSVYAIGDVHGCLEELQDLVSKCVYHSDTIDKTPVVILLGDLIDRGPAFIDIFNFIEKCGVTCLLGNHELNFYLEALGVKECRSKARKENHKMFETYGKDVQDRIIESIGNMPNGVVLTFVNNAEGTPFNTFILTHSPIRSVEYVTNKNDEFDIVRLMNGPQCNMRSELVDFDQLEETFQGIMMVHGHQSWNFKPIPEQAEEQNGYINRVINIDSGCVYGDVLTALCLNNNQFLEVKAKKAYSERH